MTTEANIELPLDEIGSDDEGELFDALRRRFPVKSYALLAQVSNATGGRRTRIADALAMSLWPSRGVELHGFEFKRHRTDWAGELKTPEKAEAFAKFCHRWWLVAAHDEIVRPGELPPAWGLLVLGSRGLVCEKEAPLLTPEPLTIDFIAAILQRVQEAYVPKKYITRLLRIEREDATASERESINHQFEWLKERVAEFKRVSGVNIESLSWEAGEIGDAVRLVLENRGLLMRRYLDDLREQTRVALTTLDAMAGVIRPKEEDDESI